MTDEESIGFVRVGEADLAAVALASGDVIWRQPNSGRPIAATSNHLISLVVSGDEPALLVFAATTGDKKGVISNTGFPSWARDVLDQPETAQFDVHESRGKLLIDWQLQYRYRGGAAPRLKDSITHEQETASGRISFDLTSGTTRIEPLESSSLSLRTEADAVLERAGPPVPGEIAHTRTEHRQYFLCAAPDDQGAIDVRLEAHDLLHNEKIWEAALGKLRRARPKPLRK